MKRKLHESKKNFEIQAKLNMAIKQDNPKALLEHTQGKQLQTILTDAGIKFPIHHIAQHGCIKILKHLIEKDPHLLSAKDDKLFTPLHAAVIAGQYKILPTMLQSNAGYFINDRNEQGETALNIAIDKGNFNAAKILIEHKADLELPNRFEGGLKPLIQAMYKSDYHVMDLLLEAGANIEAKDFNGFTPLYTAVELGDFQAVKYLIAKGADIKYHPTCKNYLLTYATKQGNEDIIKMIINDPNFSKDHIKHAMWSAIQKGYTEIVKILLKDCYQEDKPLFLYKAVERGHKEIVNLFLQNDINLNIAFSKGETCLHIATRNNDLDIARNLLKHGANLEANDENGADPIHRAFLMGNVEMTSLLLQSKAKVAAKTANNNFVSNSSFLKLVLNSENGSITDVSSKAQEDKAKVSDQILNMNFSSQEHNNALCLGYTNQSFIDEYELWPSK